MHEIRPSRRLLLGAAVAALAVPRAASAQGAPPRDVVERFHATLIEVMRDAARLGVRGRAQRLRPAMEAAFDLSAMTRIAVGPAWSGMAADQQAQLVQAFSDWTVANYASQFKGFSGESFTTTGEQTLQNNDRLVRTTLNRVNDTPVQLNYLMRPGGAGWRIVDVYLTGTISELASRRSEFAALLRDGGPARLVGDLQRRTAALMQG